MGQWDGRRIIIIIPGASSWGDKYYFRRNIGPGRRVRLVVNWVSFSDVIKANVAVIGLENLRTKRPKWVNFFPIVVCVIALALVLHHLAVNYVKLNACLAICN